MAKQIYIYKIAFITPPTGENKTEYYFTSLAAIYDKFSPEQVGCAVQHLYNLGISNGETYIGRKATITRESLVSKAQTKPHKNSTEKQR